MRLTQPLHLPPVFRFWKDFGAGRRHRMPYFKYWKHYWKRNIGRQPRPDHTLKLEQLPAGSRLMDGEDFLCGPIDAMPEELIKMKNEKVIYDHPWPYNISLDPIEGQPLVHNYSITTRFFLPKQDCQVLTNTLLRPERLEANPIVEPTDEHLEIAQRHFDWSTEGDSVLVRLPKQREFPKVNIKPSSKYGITKERKEVHVLNSLQSLSQTILANHLHQNGKTMKLRQIFDRRALAFPKCNTPFDRQGAKINLDVCIDSLMLGKATLPLIDSHPESTKDVEPVDIHPRSWKSLIEKTRKYSPDWSFSLPKGTNPHTIMVASRIKRDHTTEDEMLARVMIHSFAMTSQFARLKALEQYTMKVGEDSKQSSTLLLDPLSVPSVNDKDLLEKPVVLQAIGFDLTLSQFHFMRYQLNTLNFSDDNKYRVKNQAWYSGPINDLSDVLRYYLDFQSFDSLEDELLERRVRYIDEHKSTGVVT